jgi:uncharacterized protein (DUF302 family)
MHQLLCRKTILRTLLFMIAAILGGNSYADKKQFPKIKLTPFTNVATINAVTGPGGINHEESDKLAKKLANVIATYVATVDDTAPPTEFPANWVLGGFEGDVTIEEAILHIPTPFVINPDLPMSTTNRKKVNIIEMCNPLFAKKALGLLPVVEDRDDTKIVNGTIHAPALPCETAVYFDGTKIQIDTLNPVAIFTLFFTDVLFGEQMQDPKFAQEIQELPVQVNDEIMTIIYAALDSAEVTFTKKHKPLGPKYQWLDEVVEEVANTPFDSPFVHFTYTKLDTTTPIDATYVKHIAETIIAAASTDGSHDLALDEKLNETDWRSARPGPLPIPGNQVVEMCSPTNAIKAMSTGMHHATALPCEVSVAAIEGGSKLLISYLDPHFMFNALFKDAFNQMSKEELAEFAALPPLVLEDLQTIVDYALDGLGELSEPKQVCYNMLPTADGYCQDD